VKKNKKHLLIKMTKNTFLRTLPLLAVFFSLTIHAQNNRHNIIRCSGPIPEDFLPNKIKTVLLSNDVNKSAGKNKKLFTNFSLGNNYAIYNQLVSGYVIYGTPLNNYIDRVADKLLANDIELRKKIRFYVFESPQVNAFAFSNGIIFLNIGLFAHLKNEAQLAFVMSHEIAHYKQEHSFKAYTHQKTLSRKERKSFEESSLREELNFTRFSRIQEQDADEIGFNIFKESGYKLNEALGLLDVLSMSEYPFDSLRLQKDFLNGTYLKIPEKYFINGDVKAIAIDTNEIDSLRTHPAIPKRKQSITLKIGDQSQIGKSFLVSEEEFYKRRNECRYELSRLYMLDKDYVKSIYNCYLLMTQDPDNEYFYEVLVKSLYFLQINFNNSSKRDVVLSKYKAAGETARIHYMLSNMKTEELNVWCLRKSWEYHTKFPDNEEIFAFTKKITQHFKSEFAEDVSYFFPIKEYNDSLIQSFYVITQQEEIEEKKKNNKGRKSNKIRVVNRGSYAKYSMPDFITQKHFLDVYESLPLIAKIEENEEEKSPKKTQRVTQKPKKELDINKIIIADLTQISVDERKSEPILYRAMEKRTQLLMNSINICAQKNNLDVLLMLPEATKESDSTIFADRNIIIKYLDERRRYSDLDELYGVDYGDIKKLTEKYQTKYVGVIYNAGFILKKDWGGVAFEFLVSFFYPPLIPFTIYDAVKPDKESYLGFALFDVSNGKIVYIREQTFNTDSNPDLLKSELYNIFLKIKNK